MKRDHYASRTRRRAIETEEEKGKRNEILRRQHTISNTEGKQALCSLQHDQGTSEEHERGLRERRGQDAEEDNGKWNEIRRQKYAAAVKTEEMNELRRQQRKTSNTEERNELLRHQEYAVPNTEGSNELLRRQEHAVPNTEERNELRRQQYAAFLQVVNEQWNLQEAIQCAYINKV